MLAYPLIAAFAIMLASLAGVVFASRKLGDWSQNNLPFLATFSIGIFAVITWELFGEALDHGTGAVVVLSVIGGAILVMLLSGLIRETHHHHDPHQDHQHSHLDARKLLIGDTMHNLADGLLLVPAFLADVRIGIATAVGIFLHELVSEISEFFILREAGYTVRQALIRNFAASSTILLGVLAAALLSSVESLEAPLIGLSAGGFLYVILRDLVPHTMSNIRRKGRGDRHILALVVGLLVMLGINALIPHAEALETIENYEAIKQSVK